MANLHDGRAPRFLPPLPPFIMVNFPEFPGGLGPQKISRHNSWQGVAEADEFQAFFDCYETREEMLQRVNSGEGPSGPRRYPLERIRSGEGQRSLGLVPEVWLMVEWSRRFSWMFCRSKGEDS